MERCLEKGYLPIKTYQVVEVEGIASGAFARSIWMCFLSGVTIGIRHHEKTAEKANLSHRGMFLHPRTPLTKEAIEYYEVAEAMRERRTSWLRLNP